MLLGIGMLPGNRRALSALLSLSERERIKVRDSFRKFAENRVEDSAKIFPHQKIPEPNFFDPARGQKRSALGVARLPLRMPVFPSIEFNGEARRGTIKVQSVATKIVLSAKFVFCELPVTQMTP